MDNPGFDATSMTQNEDSMLPPAMLRDLLNAPDDSKDLEAQDGEQQQQENDGTWDQYRVRHTATPADTEEDVERDYQDEVTGSNVTNEEEEEDSDEGEETPKAEVRITWFTFVLVKTFFFIFQKPAINSDKSIISTFTRNMGLDNPGLAIRAYDDELKKKDKEIIDLKLRIYLLEEQQGIIETGDGSKDNAARIVFEIKVEKARVEQELAEKVKQLQDAYFAVDELERQSEEQKDALRSEIAGLKEELQAARDSSEQQRREHVNSSMLAEAFGSMYLDAHPEENNQQQQQQLQELAKTVEDMEKELADKMKQINEVEGELIVEQDNCRDLRSLVDGKDEKIARLEAELKERTSEAQMLQEQNSALKGQLDLDQRSMEEMMRQHESEISVLNNRLAVVEQEKETLSEKLSQAEDDHGHVDELERQLEEERSSNKVHEKYLNEKLVELANLHKELDAAKQTITERKEVHAKTEENLTKTTLCIDGLAEVTKEQKEKISSLEQELAKKTAMLERMIKEYEVVKKIVRQYREERKSQRDSGSLISELDDAKGREAILRSEVERLKDLVSMEDGGRSSIGSERSVFISQDQDKLRRHVHLLDRELEAAKQVFLQEGASKALAKAEVLYNSKLQEINQDHGNTIRMMQQHLQNLIRVFQKLLSDEPLEDVSLVDLLNESERFSMSLNTSLNDPNETQVPPVVEIDFAELLKSQSSNLMESMSQYKSVCTEMRQELEEEKRRVLELTNQLSLLADQLKEAETRNVQLNQNLSKVQNASEKIVAMEEETLKLQRVIKTLETEVTELNSNARTAEATIVERNAVIENLRIKYGSTKEKNRKLQDEVILANDLILPIFFTINPFSGDAVAEQRQSPQATGDAQERGCSPSRNQCQFDRGQWRFETETE